MSCPSLVRHVDEEETADDTTQSRDGLNSTRERGEKIMDPKNAMETTKLKCCQNDVDVKSVGSLVKVGKEKSSVCG